MHNLARPWRHANLEAPDVRQFALEDPRGFLRQFPAGALLDEVQRAPELLPKRFLPLQPDSSQGLMTGTPAARKEAVSRVATVNPCAAAIAAIWPSATEMARPAARARPTNGA